MLDRNEVVGLAGPLNFSGPAFQRDRSVKEDNDNVKLDVSAWMATLAEQDEAMSKSEKEFFAELRSLEK